MRRRILAVVALAALCSGCAGSKLIAAVPTSGVAPARTALAAMGGCIDVIEPLVPDSEDARAAFTSLRSVHSVGGGLVDSWEELGEAPRSWSRWVTEALEALENTHDALKRADVPIPAAVTMAIGAAQLIWPIIAAVVG